MKEQGDVKDPEGYEQPSDLGDYPLDSLTIRTETRTIHEVVTRRIGKGFYIMDPDFQRDFVWNDERQSRLIESVLMRIPLPVFYLAENPDGKLVVVDGLQRLTTFQKFLTDKLKLKLQNPDLKNKKFSDLPAKLQNRIEDTQLTLYLIDSKVPDRARLDIFERVNGGVPLTRQQMRNALYQGKATRALKELAHDPLFVQATGGSLDSKTMRDREAVNRFCAFHLLGSFSYGDDMDQFLGDALAEINKMPEAGIDALKAAFLQSMSNNLLVFGKHAFRKHDRDRETRSTFNMSLFDVFSTGLARYEHTLVDSHKEQIRDGFFLLMKQEEFVRDITYGTNGRRQVEGRFRAAEKLLVEVFDAH
ncbi:DUF262 domain-containing protein [Sorangium sp. So ce1335]|uniref:DUF262 domain-containing protein n=1 Tax=Sorangium sp. So ce1335 TaxID=3133335 RepID=UPI003F624DAB